MSMEFLELLLFILLILQTIIGLGNNEEIKDLKKEIKQLKDNQNERTN